MDRADALELMGSCLGRELTEAERCAVEAHVEQLDAVMSRVEGTRDRYFQTAQELCVAAETDAGAVEAPLRAWREARAAYGSALYQASVAGLDPFALVEEIPTPDVLQGVKRV